MRSFSRLLGLARRGAWLLAAVSLAALLVLAACGDDDDDGAATQTPNGTGSEATTAAPGDNGDETTPPDSGDETGSAIITFFGDVDGALDVQGISCDHFPNAEDDDTDDAFTTSISGDSRDGDESYTLTVSSNAIQETAFVTLTRGGIGFGKWDNQDLVETGGFAVRPESGTATITDEGGELNFTLAPVAVDAGGARETVAVAGTWTCPGGAYKTFGG